MHKEINSFIAISIVALLALALGFFSFFASKKAADIELSVTKKAFEAGNGNDVSTNRSPDAQQAESSQTEANADSAEKQIGFIKSLYQKGDKWFLSIDYAQWLAGEEAEKAMRNDGECPKTGECIVLNDYYLRNPSSVKRNFEISPSVSVYMQTYHMEKDGIIQWDQKISFAEFSQIFSSDGESRLKDVPYWIELNNDNLVIKISEQYIP